MGNTWLPPVQTRTGVILCVDDNLPHLELLSAILSKNGFSILQAKTGEDALEMLSEAPVCLVIADHLLRGVTGTELAAKMKAVKPSVPVLLCSGSQPDSMRNVDAFINKGEPVHVFLAFLDDLLTRFYG